jgi:integrase
MRLRHGAFFYADSRGGQKPWVLIGRTYADAIVRYAALEAAVATRRDFNALADRYIVEAKMADSTRTVRKTLLKKLRTVFGSVLPADIEQVHAYRYMDERGKAVGKQEVILLSAILTWGVKKGWLRSNALHGIKLDTQPRRKRYLTDAELAAILAAAPTEVAQAVRFMSYTALRVGDALRVRWRDYKADGLHVAVSKTDSALVFDRTPGLVALMADLKQRRIGSLFVIADRQGRQWDYKRLYAEWRKVAPVDANIHDLRRKRITDLTRERGLEFARVLAAHSNPKMTASYDVGEKRVAV